MNTTRRQFISTLIAAPAALVALSKATPKASEPELTVKTYPLNSRVRYAMQGWGVKVPSNRVLVEDMEDICRNGYHPGINTHHRYLGNWDGTFKVERGCTNPAHILANLIEQTDRLGGGDWVTNRRTHPWQLDWQMLYDFGRWCDELDTETVSIETWEWHVIQRKVKRDAMCPRMMVKIICQTPEHLELLREHLRMHCLRWQSTDPRYRTSYPV